MDRALDHEQEQAGNAFDSVVDPSAGEGANAEASLVSDDVPVAKDATIEPRAGLVEVVLAPWRHIFSPARAAVVMVRGSSLSILAASAFATVVLYVAALSWDVVDRVLETVWVGSEPSVVINDISDVLMGYSEAELIEILGALVISLVMAWIALTLVQIPLIHSRRKGWDSFDRAARAILACSGSLLIFFLIIAVIITIENWTWSIRWEDYSRTFWGVVLDFCLPVLGMSGAVYVVWTTDQAARAVCPPTPTDDVIRHCESCSYDLAHVPESGRCPECGGATVVSIDPTHTRSGIEWETSPTARSWIATVRECIFRPTAFYQRLQMQTDDSLAWRFARLNHLFVGIANALVISATLTLFEYERLSTIVTTLIAGSLMTTMAAYAWHRGIGALAFMSTIFRNVAPDFFRVRKVWLYESAMVWPVWAVQMFVAFLFYLGDGFLVEWLFNFNPNYARVLLPTFILGEIGLMLGICGWRYGMAVKLTRWSNF